MFHNQSNYWWLAYKLALFLFHVTSSTWPSSASWGGTVVKFHLMAGNEGFVTFGDPHCQVYWRLVLKSLICCSRMRAVFESFRQVSAGEFLLILAFFVYVKCYFGVSDFYSRDQESQNIFNLIGTWTVISHC